MGSLYYGNVEEPLVMPDRILAHLAAVATTKLRRSESFIVSWRGTGEDKAGRTTLWLQPSIPLRFVYETADQIALNPATLREMADQAASNAGIMLDADIDIPELPVGRPQATRARKAA